MQEINYARHCSIVKSKTCFNCYALNYNKTYWFVARRVPILFFFADRFVFCTNTYGIFLITESWQNNKVLIIIWTVIKISASLNETNFNCYSIVCVISRRFLSIWWFITSHVHKISLSRHRTVFKMQL